MFKHITVTTAHTQGIKSIPVKITVKTKPLSSQFSINETSDTNTLNVKEILRTALRSASFELPLGNISITIDPNYQFFSNKELAFPIAIAILALEKHLDKRLVDNMLIIGALQPNGSVQPTTGMIPAANLAHELDKTLLCSPYAKELILVPGRRSIHINNLSDFHKETFEPLRIEQDTPDNKVTIPSVIHGYGTTKRLLMAATLTHQNMLIESDKSDDNSIIDDLIETYRFIAPKFTDDELLDVAAIKSAATMPSEHIMDFNRTQIDAFPNTSDEKLLGQNSPTIPGLISIANKGTLVLNECDSFDAMLLRKLAIATQHKSVHLDNFGTDIEIPVNTQVIGTIKPCPCQQTPCVCTDNTLADYHRGIKNHVGTLFEIHTRASKTPSHKDDELTPTQMRTHVRNALRTRQKRDKSSVPYTEQDKTCFLSTIFDLDGNTPKNLDTTLVLARAFADLDGDETVSTSHIIEALNYSIPQ